MSGVYRGRAGPNVTAYLNTLNYDQEQFPSEDLNFDDLAMFTNTNFTDFDIPNLPENGAMDFELEGGNTNEQVKYEELLTGTESPSAFQSTPIHQPSTHPAQFYPTYNTPIQPALPGNGFPTNEPPLALVIPPSSASPTASTAKKPDPSRSQKLAEEESRLAAEEDKRRRNTAASARFRVKKKQREQALEKTVKEINDKNVLLEARINQLETENQWLKNLITEKNGNQSKEEMAAAYQKFRKESEEREMSQERKLKA